MENETHLEKARRLFTSGYNCSQAVVGAFADELGVSEEYALKLASSFGGGMGRMREVCGAVSGMLMVIGVKRGYSVPDHDAVRSHYALVQQLAGKFRESNGSIICRELLASGGARPASSPEPTPRTASFYSSRPCLRYVEDAVRLTEEALDASPRGETPEK